MLQQYRQLFQFHSCQTQKLPTILLYLNLTFQIYQIYLNLTFQIYHVHKHLPANVEGGQCTFRTQALHVTLSILCWCTERKKQICQLHWPNYNVRGYRDILYICQGFHFRPDPDSPGSPEESKNKKIVLKSSRVTRVSYSP